MTPGLAGILGGRQGVEHVVHILQLLLAQLNLPGEGLLDWVAIIDTLDEIGYEGDITFEAMKFFKRFPAELLPDAARLMCAVGRHLAKKASGR